MVCLMIKSPRRIAGLDGGEKWRRRRHLMVKCLQSSQCGSAVRNSTQYPWRRDPWPRSVGYGVGRADVPWILHCSGFGVGWPLQLWGKPYPGSFHTPQMRSKKGKKKCGQQTDKRQHSNVKCVRELGLKAERKWPGSCREQPGEKRVCRNQT